MRKIFVLLILKVIGSFIPLQSQNTFNEEIKVMDFISNASSVVQYKDTIVVVGCGTDYYSYRDYYFFYAKYDKEGNFIKRYIDSIGDFTNQLTNDSYLIGDTLITVINKLTLNDEGTKYIKFEGIVYVIDLNQDTIIKKIVFVNPKNTKDTPAVTGLSMIDSIYCAVISAIYKNDYIDSQITLINIKTGEVKYIQFGRPNVSDTPFSIFWTGEKLLVGSYFRDPEYNWENSNQKRYYHTLIYEVDTSGIVNEAFVSDTTLSTAFEIMQDQQKNILYLSAYYKYSYDSFFEKYNYRFHLNIVKLDSNYNLLWHRPIGLDHDFINLDGGHAKILKAIDEGGYIASGFISNHDWDITTAEREEMIAAGNAPKYVGFLEKISEEGQTIWLRTYSLVNYLDLASINDIGHEIKDLTYSNDGGYIGYGDLHYSGRVGIDTAANYHNWLIKVDKYGCLVPGCELGDTVSINNISNPLDVSIYPNPASDYLYILDKHGGDSEFIVSDLSGNIINKWTGSLSDHTYILDVRNFTQGIYFVRKQSKEGVIVTEKFVVSR